MRYTDYDEFRTYSIADIKNINYNDIDWDDLEEECKDVKGYSDETIEKILYELEKIFIKENKLIVNGYDKDIVIYKVLEEIILNYPLKVSAVSLKNDEYCIDSGIKNAVDKSLKVLTLYEIINKNKNTEQFNKKEYTLNLEKWFKRSQYRINDEELLATLAPLITSYINIGFRHNFNIEVFFQKISEVMRYISNPPIEHNEHFFLEYEIFESIADKKSLDIFIKFNDSYIERNIQPIAIVFKKHKKYVDYIDTEINKNKIVSKELEDFKLDLEVNIEENYEDTGTLNPMLSNYTINNLSKRYNIKNKKVDIILECDSIVYEYFKIHPLQNMVIHDDKENMKKIYKEFDSEINKNKFYITASDYKEQILSTVFNTLKYVKIIKPQELKDDISERMKIFASKNDINLCDEGDSNKFSPTNYFSASKKEDKKIKEINKNYISKYDLNSYGHMNKFKSKFNSTNIVIDNLF